MAAALKTALEEEGALMAESWTACTNARTREHAERHTSEPKPREKCA